jgi:hypothetical protein
MNSLMDQPVDEVTALMIQSKAPQQPTKPLTHKAFSGTLIQTITEISRKLIVLYTYTHTIFVFILKQRKVKTTMNGCNKTRGCFCYPERNNGW